LAYRLIYQKFIVRLISLDTVFAFVWGIKLTPSYVTRVKNSLERRTRPLFAAVNTKCHSTYPSRVQGSRNSFQSVQSFTSCYSQLYRSVDLSFYCRPILNRRATVTDSLNSYHDSHKLVKSDGSKGGQGTTPPW